MISHEHKCIFIHIPKTAGTSINSFFHPGIKFHYANPDYERLFGWCPKRKLQMQHATSKQLLEMELITEENWNSYYKFTFVRNPWDRAYSDYMWIRKFSNISGSFKEYITKTGKFTEILSDKNKSNYLGDHLLNQTDFFDFDGIYRPEFIGKFENFESDIKIILENLGINKNFDVFQNKSKRRSDYSLFYTNSKKRMVDFKFKKDIEQLKYGFEDHRYGIHVLKKFL